jgi:DedD protein
MIPTLDTALKHRLTGAIILILLAVLLLPELLTGSGKAAYLAARAAGETADGERRIEIDLTESVRPAPVTASTPDAAAAQAPSSAPPVTLPVPEANLSPSPVDAATEPADAAGAGAAGAGVDTPPSLAVSVSPPAASAPPAAGPAPPTAGPAQPATAAPLVAGAFFVQLGVFENIASARNLERRLRARGFAVLVEPVERSGRKLHRVRVGPEADRAAADALRRRLEEAGHKGSVVK